MKRKAVSMGYPKSKRAKPLQVATKEFVDELQSNHQGASTKSQNENVSI